MVSWLHLQFSLSRITCNAVLAILVYLLALLNPNIPHPFVTLQSATHSLGVDAHIELLPVCPTCQDVFPSAISKHVQEACPACNVPLFLSDHTKRGNQHAKKVPVIKYPYLLLSDQIESILKVPGVEALLDEWCIKPRRLGEYTNIFNGDMCHNILKAPDGSLFFSNLPHERAGPKGELWIGVNLGVDWWVLRCWWLFLTETINRFSYICSNITPSHLSCPTSFSIHNFPPKYWCVSSPCIKYVIVDFLGITCQTSYVWVFSQGLRNRTWMKFNNFSIQSSLIFYDYGEMVL